MTTSNRPWTARLEGKSPQGEVSIPELQGELQLVGSGPSGMFMFTYSLAAADAASRTASYKLVESRPLRAIDYKPSASFEIEKTFI